jgi:lipid-binding SYLF domain-containing protein
MALCSVIFRGGLAWADEKQDATHLVEKARLAFESFVSENDSGLFHDLLRRAEGIFIAPQFLRGAFIFGASGGNGVFLVRDKKTGDWSCPAFYTLGGVSFGVQFGGSASELILLVMTDRGVSSLLGSNVKLGVDADLALGPWGAGVAASTANLSADIMSFSRSQGLFAGISLDGAVVAAREGLNQAFYGKWVSPTDILVRRGANNPQALGLISAVAKFTTHNSASRQ